MGGIIFSLSIFLLIFILGMHIHSSALAQGSNSTGVNNTLNLGSPVFIEYYNIISSKKTMVNGTEATEVVILGNGTIKGINITSTGKALIMPRSNGAPYIEGAADFKTNSGKATYAFQAIGNYGAAFFDSNATGNLSFLNNMVGIYKIDRIEGGDDVFTMWNWSSTDN
ncbi:MAG TPA: hypothetical protein VE548_00855 [Nitrososphaeraceae archaeon]|jgi:hypothetical protein|nr:hypothetical protein [Nitrososphaeraceae archaeon]